MLRRICGRCGSIIDGEPDLEKEYADAVLVIDDEIAAIYDDLCDGCRVKMVRLFNDFCDKVERPSSVSSSSESATITDEARTETVEPSENHPKGEAPSMAPDEPAHNRPLKVERYKPIDKDELPNQVTRQFPINLPKRD